MEVKEPSAGYFLINEPQLTEIGPLPADWSVSTVGDEFHVQLGKMLDTEKNVGTPKLFLGNRAVQWGQIDVSDVGEIRMSPSELQRYRLVDGDLLICEGGEVGRSAIWRDQLEECYYQKALHRLRPKRGYLNKESHYLWGKRYLLEISHADAAPNVSLTPRKLKLQVRPGADQARCEEVLDGWYRQQVRDAVPALLEKWEPLLKVKAQRVFVQPRARPFGCP